MFVCCACEMCTDVCDTLEYAMNVFCLTLRHMPIVDMVINFIFRESIVKVSYILVSTSLHQRFSNILEMNFKLLYSILYITIQ